MTLTLEAVLLVVLAILMIPLMARLWRGPTAGDRILALEVIGGMGTLMMAAISVTSQRTVYLDVAVLLALFSFLGTLAIARYLERGLIS
jgi:multicomponent Na+:H+ antiporter subunit F